MTKQPFCEVLKISLVVITCLGVITFSGVTNLSEVMLLSRVIVSLVKVACFTKSTYVKDADTEGVNTEGASIGVICTKDTYIRDALTCVSGAYIRS